MANDLEKVELKEADVVYGTFWLRMGALGIDILLLFPFIFTLNYFNKTSWKNLPLAIFTSLIFCVYKIVFEYQTGATFGKKILKLVVVNHELKKAKLKDVLIRNIFNIQLTLTVIVLTIILFQNPDFQNAHTLKQTGELSRKIPGYIITVIFSAVVLLVEAISFFTDKKSRSLHDRIGKTLVIKVVDK